ncbi:hypothetical protein DFH07DRAFT_318531 [Mycena maculata]|uniref:GST N-terminal domain-containing protein n=1 Tax=Mycena maculata TaxID=230809 RepID=A0AAD7KB87_9AGAR|nr:hypothetical protein DFH07DRAFT_318531 [Mycena maculata]
MSNEPILFYDIPSTAPGCAWSPATWRIRYALNLKGLKYKTVWVEYPDIADLCKRIGAAPSMIRKNGSPYYSLPVIEDPNTGTVLSDSPLIAEYLDAAYPDTHRLIPPGTRTLQKSFSAAYDDATDPVVSFIVPAVARILRPRSEEYFIRTREADFGKKLTEMEPTGEEYDVAWKAFETGLGKVSAWMKADEPFVMGDVISFADLVVAGEMQWFMKAFGEGSDKWKDMLSWHNGRWAKLIDNLKKYEGPAEETPDL